MDKQVGPGDGVVTGYGKIEVDPFIYFHRTSLFLEGHLGKCMR